MESKGKIIYFHGFGSSGASGTVQLLRHALSGYEIIAPDIPLNPEEALPFLKELCEKEQPILVMGTSMGGMYAQQMRGYRRLLINPAFWMSRMSKVLKLGTFTYFNKRKDKQMQGRVTKEIIASFRQMESHQFEGIDDAERELCHAMFGNHDPLTATTYKTFTDNYLAANAQKFDGEHRVNDVVLKKAILPKLRVLLNDDQI